MKSKMLVILSCVSLFLSPAIFASCGGYGDYDQDGGCGENLFDNSCQCTDPVCQNVDKGCLSKGECCEAFGNVGAR